jgi:hypothetical protein
MVAITSPRRGGTTTGATAMRERNRRRLPAVAGRRLAVVLVALAVAFPLVALASTAAAAATPPAALQVAPANDIDAGAQITFVGTGFLPGVALRLEECSLAGLGPDPSRCTAIGDSLLLVAPDGSVQGTATVVTGPVGAAPDAVCPAAAPRACSVWLVAAGAGGASAGAAIGFAPGVPAPPASAAVVAPPAPPTVAPPRPLAPAPAPTVPASTVPASIAPTTRPPAPVAAGGSLAARPRAGTKAWTFGLVGLIVAGLVAGAARAKVGLRRVRRSRRIAGIEGVDRGLMS